MQAYLSSVMYCCSVDVIRIRLISAKYQNIRYSTAYFIGERELVSCFVYSCMPRLVYMPTVCILGLYTLCVCVCVMYRPTI